MVIIAASSFGNTLLGVGSRGSAAFTFGELCRRFI
jgi:hypothetical protein